MTAIMFAVLFSAGMVSWFLVDIRRDLGRIAKTLETLEELLSKRFREENH